MPSLKFWVVMVVVLAAGCSGRASDGGEGTTVAVAEGTVVPMPEGGAVDTVSPQDGVWDLAMLEGHLANAGIEATPAGEIRQPFMGARGVRFRIATGELQAFIYADAGARARDTDLLDSAILAAPTGRAPYPVPVSVVTSNNLAVIVVSEDSTLRRGIMAAISGGRR